jgi:AGCS family alanine or glycine:cation symporter
LAGAGIVWTFGDIAVGAMAWLNIVAILILSPKALRTLRDYERQKKEGKEPVFNPEKLKIEGVEYWKS